MPNPNKITTGIASGINTTAIRVHTGTDRPNKGIELKADVGNSGVLYVGGADVSTASGYPLAVISSVGESVFIPTSKPDEIYVIGDANSVNDKLRYYMV